MPVFEIIIAIVIYLLAREIHHDLTRTHSVVVSRSDAVISKGKYGVFDFAILHHLGFRLGYIRIPEGHPWHDKGYDEIDCEVHGGLTYTDGEREDFWIGFDCAHAWDAQDPSLPTECKMPKWGESTIKGTDYVKTECINLCIQAEVINENEVADPSTLQDRADVERLIRSV